MGARGWDNYSWHTDLPPGHPMVTGQQTVDFDLCNVEHCNLAICWGMNWITTKMPDAHWLTEARLKGTKVVVISAEYSATANKADEVVIVRPGTTPALALGIAQVMMDEGLYDSAYVRANTDLPLLVRLDDGQLLRAADVFPGYRPAELENNIVLAKAGGPKPAVHKQPGPVVSEAAAMAMADGVRRALGADVGLATTGVAGPTEQEGQPVGTVFLGLALGDRVEAQHVRLPGDRERVRQYSVISLLNLLRRRLLARSGDLDVFEVASRDGRTP